MGQLRTVLGGPRGALAIPDSLLSVSQPFRGLDSYIRPHSEDSVLAWDAELATLRAQELRDPLLEQRAFRPGVGLTSHSPNTSSHPSSLIHNILTGVLRIVVP